MIQSTPTICTIIAKNYLAHARTLAQSFLEYHPEGKVFVLLVDEIEDYFDPAQEPFTLILAKEIDIPHFAVMTFRYTVLELSTAVKPYFLEYLITQHGCAKVCYFDPDIIITHPLDEIFTLLQTRLMVLVPHLLDFLEDGCQPDEPYILRAGVYNLGFIGVAHHPELARFLGWWQRRLEKHAVVDPARGLFTDQRWMDLAPGFFKDVCIHHDPGCDVAYWNLNHRQIKQTESGYLVNGSPLKFFHFSGFSVEDIDTISKHQNRYTLADLPHLRPIYEGYRTKLIENGYDSVKNWPYAYQYFYFDNGCPVPKVAQLIWRESEADTPDWADPFNTSSPQSFLAWLIEPVDQPLPGQPIVTQLAWHIYKLRLDLQSIFPDGLGQNRWAFVEWFVRNAQRDHQLDYDLFIKPIAESLAIAHQEQLTSLKTELNSIYNSRTWRIAKKLQAIYKKFR